MDNIIRSDNHNIHQELSREELRKSDGVFSTWISFTWLNFWLLFPHCRSFYMNISNILADVPKGTMFSFLRCCAILSFVSLGDLEDTAETGFCLRQGLGQLRFQIQHFSDLQQNTTIHQYRVHSSSYFSAYLLC